MLSQARITLVSPTRPAANDACSPSSVRLAAIKAMLREMLIHGGEIAR